MWTQDIYINTLYTTSVQVYCTLQVYKCIVHYNTLHATSFIHLFLGQMCITSDFNSMIDGICSSHLWSLPTWKTHIPGCPTLVVSTTLATSPTWDPGTIYWCSGSRSAVSSAAIELPPSTAVGQFVWLYMYTTKLSLHSSPRISTAWNVLIFSWTYRRGKTVSMHCTSINQLAYGMVWCTRKTSVSTVKAV